MTAILCWATKKNLHGKGWDLAEWLERLTVNAVVAIVLGSIPASSDTVESEGRQMKQCRISYIKKIQKNPILFLNLSKILISGPAGGSDKMPSWSLLYSKASLGHLKVHKIEIFFGFDFEICIISLLVMWKY